MPFRKLLGILGFGLCVALLVGLTAGRVAAQAGTTATILGTVTDSSGAASVTLTLPGSPQTVNVQAEAPIALGQAIANFTETAQ